jgi:hypothetical protein
MKWTKFSIRIALTVACLAGIAVVLRSGPRSSFSAFATIVISVVVLYLLRVAAKSQLLGPHQGRFTIDFLARSKLPAVGRGILCFPLAVGWVLFVIAGRHIGIVEDRLLGIWLSPCLVLMLCGVFLVLKGLFGGSN